MAKFTLPVTTTTTGTITFEAEDLEQAQQYLWSIQHDDTIEHRLVWDASYEASATADEPFPSLEMAHLPGYAEEVHYTEVTYGELING
jgi:hypothetical protein